MRGAAERARRRHRSHAKRSRPRFDLRLPRPVADALQRLPRPDVGQTARAFRAALTAHPRRAAAFGVLGVVLLGFVATHSLPLALLGRNLDLAAMLAPNNALVLKAQAQRARAELQHLMTPPASEAPPTADADATADAAASPAPDRPAADPAAADRASAVSGAAQEAADPEDDVSREQRIGALRAQISDLAERVLVRLPLDAEAMRLKAEMQNDPVEVERTMRDAYARSRREPVAAFWLLNKSYEDRDFSGVTEMADVLMRTSPGLAKFTLSYLYSIAADPDGRALLAQKLATSPPWRATFFRTLGDFVSNEDAVALFLAMKEAGAPPAGTELGPYLHARLFKAKDAEGSYNTWLQLLSDEELATLLPVRNMDFAQDPSGLPFDWTIGRGRNVTTRFTRLPGKSEERALRVQFGVGRVRFGGVLQVTAMRPGPYRFAGRQSGNMSAKRGMKWQVRCFPSNVLAGESSQLFGSARGWQDFSFDFTIPAEPGCAVQIVRLIHDARSASEEYASGEIAFTAIRVTAQEPAASAGTGSATAH
ncbi:MAG: hypothetical protein AB1592_05095 [Pseudomonadota bacterium]